MNLVEIKDIFDTFRTADAYSYARDKWISTSLLVSLLNRIHGDGEQIKSRSLNQMIAWLG